MIGCIFVMRWVVCKLKPAVTSVARGSVLLSMVMGRIMLLRILVVRPVLELSHKRQILALRSGRFRLALLWGRGTAVVCYDCGGCGIPRCFVRQLP